MANRFGPDILIQSPNPRETALFYVEQLGFEITDETEEMVSPHGEHINLFIERGKPLGPLFCGNGTYICTFPDAALIPPSILIKS